VAYVDCARNLLAGCGFQDRGRPLRYWPPGYPCVLALGGLLTGDDPLASGRWLHVSLHALLGCLMAWAAYRVTGRSVLGAALIMGLFLTTDDLLPLSSNALSVIPSFVFVLLALLCLARGLATGRGVLISIAFILGAASIIVGPICVALWPVVGLSLLLFGPGSARKRWVILILGSVVMFTPLALWLVRTWWVFGTLTGRPSAFNWLTRTDLKQFSSTLARFTLPVPPNILAKASKLEIGVVLALGMLVLAYAGSLLLRRVRTEYREQYPLSFESLLLVMLPLFAGSYVSTLIASKLIHDAYTSMDAGHLFPAILVLQLFVLGVLFRTPEGRNPGKIKSRIVLSVYVILYMALSSNSWVSVANHLHKQGLGFTEPIWAQSEGVDYLKSLPDSIRVITNAPDVYFLSGRLADMLPWKFEPTSRRPNPQFAEEMAVVRDDVLSGRSQLVFFDAFRYRWYMPSQEEISRQLPELKRLSDATVFGGRRDGQAEVSRAKPQSSDFRY
jgi:hypothetical protein